MQAGSLVGGEPLTNDRRELLRYATTVFDYIRRAMPYNAPRSFSDSEVYALTAYIISLEGPTLPLPSPALMII